MKALGLLLKLVLLALLVYFIFHRLYIKNDISKLWVDFSNSFELSSNGFLIMAILLLPVNLILESQKWRIIMQSFIPMRQVLAIKSILTGISCGIVTPNRIGEYGGRVLVVEAAHNWHAVLATFINSIYQNLATIIFGFIGFLSLRSHLTVLQSSSFYIKLTFVLMLILSLFFGLFLKTFVSKIISTKTLNLSPKWAERLQAFSVIETQKFLIVFLLSILRYLVYLLQYLLLLYYFGVQISIVDACSGITVIFLIQTGIPIPGILHLFARSEIALFIWSTFHVNELAVLLTTFILWIINLALPAIVGLFVIFKTNILQSLGLEKNFK